MEVYRAECAEILKRFMERRIGHKECVAALDAALAGVIIDLEQADLGAVQQILGNAQRVVAQEIGRRTQQLKKISRCTAVAVRNRTQFLLTEKKKSR